MNLDVKNKYLAALKNCLVLVDENNKYKMVCDEYFLLKKKINEYLEEADAFCVDSERYIDKKSRCLRGNIGIELPNNINDMFTRFIELYNIIEEYKEKYGWDDSTINNIDVVLAIAKYEQFEKDIIKKYGKYEGLHIIYEIKKEAVSFEKQLGVSFFENVVNKMEVLFRINVLFPLKDLKIQGKNNILEEDINLVNVDGEVFAFRKTAELYYDNKVYIEFILLEDININKDHYYELVTNCYEQKLVRVEDASLDRKLNSKQESLY